MQCKSDLCGNNGQTLTNSKIYQELMDQIVIFKEEPKEKKGNISFVKYWKFNTSKRKFIMSFYKTAYLHGDLKRQYITGLSWTHQQKASFKHKISTEKCLNIVRVQLKNKLSINVSKNVRRLIKKRLNDICKSHYRRYVTGCKKTDWKYLEILGKKESGSNRVCITFDKSKSHTPFDHHSRLFPTDDIVKVMYIVIYYIAVYW